MPLSCYLVFEFHKVYFSTWRYCVNISSNMYLNSFWCRFIQCLQNHAITSCLHGTVSKHIRNNQWKSYCCLQRYHTSFFVIIISQTHIQTLCVHIAFMLWSGEISSWTSRLCNLVHYWHLPRVSNAYHVWIMHNICHSVGLTKLHVPGLPCCCYILSNKKWG